MCLRSLCSAPDTPGCRRKARMGRARRATARQQLRIHAGTRGMRSWQLRMPSGLQLGSSVASSCFAGGAASLVRAAAASAEQHAQEEFEHTVLGNAV